MFKKEERRRTLYYELFNSPAGKEVLADLSRNYKVLNTTFVEGDSPLSAFNEGARSVVMSLIQLAGSSPQEILQRIKKLEAEYGRTDQ